MKVGVSESAALEVVAMELKVSLMYVLRAVFEAVSGTGHSGGGSGYCVFSDARADGRVGSFPAILRGRTGPSVARENESFSRACACSLSTPCLLPRFSVPWGLRRALCFSCGRCPRKYVLGSAVELGDTPAMVTW